MYISELGEFDLIARLTRTLPTQQEVIQGVGDDCAVLDLPGDMLLLATNDSQVEGVHFTLQTSEPRDIGRKSLAVNLSDIAAMGGEPRYALVSLILPRRLPVEVLDGIYMGLRLEAEQYSVSIVGGNMAGAGKAHLVMIDITLLGFVERGHALLRSGAQIGDLVCVTGTLGDAAAGLCTLLHPEYLYPSYALEAVQSRQRTPQARVQVGRVLAQFGPHTVTAMLDISDGLSGDLGHLCKRSQVGAWIEAANLPLSHAMQSVAAAVQANPTDWALHGGEDYELLFTVSPAMVQRVIEAVQTATTIPVTVIGTIRDASEGMALVQPGGQIEPLLVKSWDHLRKQ
jgi:thiamine-monophosphate kinase